MKNKKNLERRIQDLTQDELAKCAIARIQSSQYEPGDSRILQSDYGRATRKIEVSRILGDNNSEASATATLSVVLPFLDEFAEIGAKQHKGARDGHKAVHGTAEEKQVRWDAMQAEIDSLYKKHPNWSWEELKRQAAKNLPGRGITTGLSGKSFNRHCTNPRKPIS